MALEGGHTPIFFKVSGLDLRGVRCVMCGFPLKGSKAYGYPHNGGVEVDGLKLWLYVSCDRCGYQNSWQKLGLNPRRCRIERAEPAEALKVV